MLEIVKTEQVDDRNGYDQHSQAIFRCVVRCLSVTLHQFDNRQQMFEANLLSDLIRRQLFVTKASVSTGNTENSTPMVIACYTDQLHIDSVPSVHFHYRNTIDSARILQCALLHDDKCYFALLTRDCDNGPIGNMAQCFVFMVDRTLSPAHWHHVTLARQFSITCTVDPITGNCLEFPGK